MLLWVGIECPNSKVHKESCSLSNRANTIFRYFSISQTFIFPFYPIYIRLPYTEELFEFSLLEGDNSSVIDTLNRPNDRVDWAISKTIEQIRALLAKPVFWMAIKIKRVDNLLAHTLAQWAASTNFSGCIPYLFSNIWKFNGFGPPWCINLLLLYAISFHPTKKKKRVCSGCGDDTGDVYVAAMVAKGVVDLW